MPGLLHAGGLHANNRADMWSGSRDCRVAQLARSSPLADPIGGQSRFAIRRADMDVAAKADDVLKAKIVQELEQLDVAEAAVGRIVALTPSGSVCFRRLRQASSKSLRWFFNSS